MASLLTSSEISILKAGIQTTVQDLGRTGFRHLGISQNGALDAQSLILANNLVGNTPELAGLEIVIGPIELQFHRDAWIALCGADFDASLDGVRVAPAWRTFVQAGQILKLRGTTHEYRAYLAIDGGLDVPEVLGARATSLSAGFGGHQGRALKAGDCLLLGTPHQFSKSMGVLQRTWTPEVRAIPGPEYKQFSEESRKIFWAHAWKVSLQSNRMGYRLQGHTLACDRQENLLSHAVMPGVVQVPPNGQPIVLLADAQTTGGYPRIATVIEADLWKLAQIPPGRSFCFFQTTLALALDAQERWRNELNRIDWNRHAS
jgi:biotin-dependent carboxylase-like uncharacterized protein